MASAILIDQYLNSTAIQEASSDSRWEYRDPSTAGAESEILWSTPQCNVFNKFLPSGLRLLHRNGYRKIVKSHRKTQRKQGPTDQNN